MKCTIDIRRDKKTCTAFTLSWFRMRMLNGTKKRNKHIKNVTKLKQKTRTKYIQNTEKS